MARLAEWARAVEIPSKDMADYSKPEEYAEAIQKAIGNKHILLIIDDVWSSETARLFRLGGPNCAQLLTTRNSDIADLFAGDRHIVVPELNGEQGFDLLSQIAQSVVQLDETAAKMVVEAIGGLPLGLVLVGNYIKTKMTTVPEQRIKEVLRQLGDAQRQFAVSEPQLGGHPHPSLPKGASISLDAIIKVSDDALKYNARQTLYSLSVIPTKPNTFSEEAAVYIANSSMSVLNELVRFGLLETKGQERFWIHQSISAYSRNEIGAGSAEPANRMVTYYTSFVQEHQNEYSLLDLESDNLLKAIQFAQSAKMNAELIDGVLATVPFWMSRGLFQYCYDFLDAAEDVATETKDILRQSKILLRRGRIAYDRMDILEAETLYERALDLAEEIGDLRLQSEALGDLGACSRMQDHRQEAIDYYGRSLHFAERANAPELIVKSAGNSAVLKMSYANYNEVRDDFKKCLVAAQQIGHEIYVYTTLLSLGAVSEKLGDFDEAQTYLEEVEQYAAQVDHRPLWVMSLLNLGNVALLTGDFDKAKNLYERSLLIAEDLQREDNACGSLLNLGLVSIRQRDYRQARHFINKGSLIANDLNQPALNCEAGIRQGELYLEISAFDQAEKTLLSAVEIANSEGLRELEAEARFLLAKVEYAIGELNESDRQSGMSLQIFDQLDHHKASDVKIWRENATGLDNVAKVNA